MSPAAPEGCDPTKPNVVSSKPFLFAEVTSAPPSLNGADESAPLRLDDLRKTRRAGSISWMTQDPTKLEPIKTRSIYAFEVSDGRKAMLAAEYLVDDDGKMRLVPGRPRRLAEVKKAAKGESVSTVMLPLVRQGECLHYAFVAIRGRLDVKAIADMENGLDAIFRWRDLSVESSFLRKGDQRYIPVIDPITIALSLNAAYQEKANEVIKYVVPYKENEEREEVLLRARKLDLAHKIKDTLLSDAHGNAADPLDIRGCLTKQQSGKLEVDDYIENEAKHVAGLDTERNKAANRLIWCLESSLWSDCVRWYHGKPADAETLVAAEEIGHQLIDAFGRSLERIGEAGSGKAYLKYLVANKDTNLLRRIYHPGKEEGEGWEEFRRFFPIVHRGATGAVIAFAETAPALLVHHRREVANHLIQLTVDIWFEGKTQKESTAITRVNRRGFVTRLVGLPEAREYVRIPDSYKVKAKLEEWIEHGEKAHWPEHSKPAKVATVATWLLAAVSLVNTINKILEVRDKFKKRGEDPTTERALAIAEAAAATLDLVVALEDPVKELAHHIRAVRGAGAAVHAQVAAESAQAVAASEQEAASFVTKLKGPAGFKMIGAAGAAIDTFVYAFEAHAAFKKGDSGVGFGNAVVAGGSFVMMVGSGLNAFALAGQGMLALTAAASVLLVAGLVIACIGFVLINYFHKNEWQKFALYCSFGKQGQDGLRLAQHGHESWSGGDFSEWEPDDEGYQRQIDVLTGLLCAFRVAGDKYDEHTIMVTFNAILPCSKLHLDFEIRYESGETKRPSYVVDLDHPKEAAAFSGDARVGVKPDITWKGAQVGALQLRVVPLVNSRVKFASCEVAIRYAPHSSARIATGVIPIEGGFKYQFVRNGHVLADELVSTEVEGREIEVNVGRSGQAPTASQPPSSGRFAGRHEAD